MRKMPILLLSLSLLPTIAPAADPVDRLNLAVADRHVVPGYLRLAQQTAQLHQTAQDRCDDGDDGRQALQKVFADAFLAWQGIQHIRFGPIQVLSRDFRFQLWPDKRGSVGKHLARLLADRDPAQLDPDTFASGSAAVQGFGALERLLFDPPGVATDPAWRCRVTLVMTRNLQQMADETLAGWRDGEQAHRLLFATASGGNAYYGSADELRARLLNNLHTQLQRIVDQKLARPLGGGPDQAFPHRAEAWRSGLSLAAIRENLRAVAELYRLGFAPSLNGSDLDRDLTARFQDALQVLDGITPLLADAVHDRAAWDRLDGLRRQLAVLRTRVGGELSQALALPLGFNSLDGD